MADYDDDHDDDDFGVQMTEGNQGNCSLIDFSQCDNSKMDTLRIRKIIFTFFLLFSDTLLHRTLSHYDSLGRPPADMIPFPPRTQTAPRIDQRLVLTITGDLIDPQPEVAQGSRLRATILWGKWRWAVYENTWDQDLCAAIRPK